MASWQDLVNSTPFGGAGNDGSGNKKAGETDVNNAMQNYNSVKPASFTPVQQQTAQQQTAASRQAGPSAYNGISTNPAYSQAQQNQMTAMSNLAANGGRNAASDSNLAQIQQGANANAQGQRGAIMQQAAMRGQSGGGNSLLASLSAQQGDTNAQNAQDLGVAANQANTGIQAGQSAASIGSNLQGQNFAEQAQIAGANDQAARFDAQQGQQNNEFNAQQGNQMGQFNAGQGNQVSTLNNYTMPQAEFNDSLSKARDSAATDIAAARHETEQQKIAAAKQGGLWNGANDKLSSLGSFSKLGGLLGMGKSGSDISSGDTMTAGSDTATTVGQGGDVGGSAVDAASLGSDASQAVDAGSMAAATGGKVPGQSKVPGDSPLNDTVPIKASPGEVVVPKTLATSGSHSQIGDFVKNAKGISTKGVGASGTAPGGPKEAMLAALGNMRKNAMGGMH